MKRLLWAVAVALATGNAFAADLPARPYTKAPPLAAAAFDWSGFYIGGNGGAAWSGKCWDIDPFSIVNPTLGTVLFAGPEGCHTADGATAGGQIGYRWQRAAFVFGVEAQGNWANLTG